jgi:hypothetical protein
MQQLIDRPVPKFFPRIFAPVREVFARRGGVMSLSPSMKLSEFFDSYVLPCFLIPTRAAKRNIDQYRESVRLWVKKTGDPPLEKITQEVASAFLARLAGRLWNNQPIRTNTIRKHCTAIQKILDLAGPRTRRNRIAAGLIAADLVYLERPAKQHRPVRDDFSLDEISLIFAACSSALQTSNLYGIPAAEWWRALFIFLPNTGLRIGTAMTATWEMFDTHYPGWLEIPPEAFKGGHQGGYFYVNSYARLALHQLRTFVSADQEISRRLFPWKNWPESANWLQECRRPRDILKSEDIYPFRYF